MRLSNKVCCHVRDLSCQWEIMFLTIIMLMWLWHLCYVYDKQMLNNVSMTIITTNSIGWSNNEAHMPRSANMC